MLAKENRITSKKDFDKFFGKQFKNAGGKSASSKFLLLKSLKSDKKNSRVGFIINTKVDKTAVVRNKIKRQLRDIMKSRIGKFENSFDLLFVVMPAIKKLDFSEIEKDIDMLLKRIKLL